MANSTRSSKRTITFDKFKQELLDKTNFFIERKKGTPDQFKEAKAFNEKIESLSSTTNLSKFREEISQYKTHDDTEFNRAPGNKVYSGELERLHRNLLEFIDQNKDRLVNTRTHEELSKREISLPRVPNSVKNQPKETVSNTKVSKREISPPRVPNSVNNQPKETVSDKKVSQREISLPRVPKQQEITNKLRKNLSDSRSASHSTDFKPIDQNFAKLKNEIKPHIAELLGIAKNADGTVTLEKHEGEYNKLKNFEELNQFIAQNNLMDQTDISDKVHIEALQKEMEAYSSSPKDYVPTKDQPNWFVQGMMGIWSIIASCFACFSSNAEENSRSYHR